MTHDNGAYVKLLVPCRVKCRECECGAHLHQAGDRITYQCDSGDHSFPVEGTIFGKPTRLTSVLAWPEPMASPDSEPRE